MARGSVPGALRRLLWANAVLLTLMASATPPPFPPVPIPPGQGRLRVYRTWLPSESLNLANIDANGVYFGSVENGGAFYRDVPPGTYHIVPESWAHNPSTTPSQDTNVAVAL